MRSRILETVSALVGVAIVVWLYEPAWLGGDNTAGSAVDKAEVLERGAKAVEGLADSPSIGSGAPAVGSTAPPADREAIESLTRKPTSEPAVHAPALQAAELAWEAARTEVGSVVTELEKLDLKFDEMEAEFAELEALGGDPEQLEDEILIRLDEIVEQYTALESRLLEAQTAEQQAEDALASLRQAPAE